MEEESRFSELSWASCWILRELQNETDQADFCSLKDSLAAFMEGENQSCVNLGLCGILSTGHSFSGWTQYQKNGNVWLFVSEAS